jgi:HD containing hydrolase-like enzyme
MEIFNELDQRLSIVPRWTVLRTIQKQSVAEHCFNVERIATQISIAWMLIIDVEELNSISQLALHHDDEEAITGDIPSPAKERVEIEVKPHIHYRIVKLADLMEAFWFLTMELNMGNTYVANHRFELSDKMYKFAKDNFDDDIISKLTQWVVTINIEKSRSYE